MFHRTETGSWITVRSSLHHKKKCFFLNFLFLCHSVILIYFSRGAHIVRWSTGSVWMGVFDCNRPLYLLYCSNKKNRFFWNCHAVLFMVSMSTEVNMKEVQPKVRTSSILYTWGRLMIRFSTTTKHLNVYVKKFSGPPAVGGAAAHLSSTRIHDWTAGH